MFATIGRRGCVSMNYEQNPMVDVKNRVELRLVLGLFFVNAPLREAVICEIFFFGEIIS